MCPPLGVLPFPGGHVGPPLPGDRTICVFKGSLLAAGNRRLLGGDELDAVFDDLHVGLEQHQVGARVIDLA